MFTVYRVPVDSYDDPPECGTVVEQFNSFPAACREADDAMYRERDPQSAYFVVPGGYSTGLIG